MEAPAWFFTKALSHRQKVLRLYKKALRNVDTWYGHMYLEARYHKVIIRARFDANKDITDTRISKQMLIDGCKEVWQKAHPHTFAFTNDPWGVAYNRNPASPDFILDDWTYPEREQYPWYFNRRTLRKKEVLKYWDQMEADWDRELQDIQRVPPPEKALPSGDATK